MVEETGDRYKNGKKWRKLGHKDDPQVKGQCFTADYNNGI
jgi:hypothetical protein